MKKNLLDPYVIAGGAEGADRLTILANATWDYSSKFLQSAGLSEGMSFLDLGCGNGAITNRVAMSFGPFTKMTAVDADESVLEFARIDAAKKGVNVLYQVFDLEGSWPAGEYDFIYVRLLLSHLRRPEELLLKIKSLLRPGGSIAIEDVDFNGHFSYPASQAFNRYVDIYRRIGEIKGVDPLIGPRLPGLVRGAGFTNIEMKVISPTYDSGPGKLMALLTLKNIYQAVIEAGLATQEEVDQLIVDLEAFTESPSSIMSLPRFFQVSAKN